MRKERQELFAQVDLYPVVTASLSDGKNPLEIAQALAKTPVKIIQLREKQLDYFRLSPLGNETRRLFYQWQRLVIMNDSADMAICFDADGVHLGNTDTPVRAVRKKFPDLLIGKSCSTLDEAFRAEQEDADYINVGPIFETNTKVGVKPVGLNLISEIKNRIHLPMTVMGGITKDNLRQVLEAGATKVAMIKGLICGDIEKNVADCLEIFRFFPRVRI
jgi:thiamine-phosphate pyrophosphorylase